MQSVKLFRCLKTIGTTPCLPTVCAKLAWWVTRHVWYHTEYEGSPHDKDGLEPAPMKEISMRAYIYEEVPHVAVGKLFLYEEVPHVFAT